MHGKSIKQVLRDNTRDWMNIAGVEGTAIGLCDDQPCIKVFASVSPNKLHDLIPSLLDGYRIVIEYTGEAHALRR